jgi:hypothetical protein
VVWSNLILVHLAHRLSWFILAKELEQLVYRFWQQLSTSIG